MMMEKNSVIINGQDITEQVLVCEMTSKPDKIKIPGGTIDGFMKTVVKIRLTRDFDIFPLIGKSFDVSIRWNGISTDRRWILSNSSNSVSLILKPSGN